MKKSSENFWRASGAQKRGSQIFRLRTEVIGFEILAITILDNVPIFKVFQKI